jgi:hypothetical protein
MIGRVFDVFTHDDWGIFLAGLAEPGATRSNPTDKGMDNCQIAYRQMTAQTLDPEIRT